MDAEQIIRKEYKGARNLMTPRIEKIGTLTENDAEKYAYEISSGDGIFNKYMVGLSIVHYNKETGRTSIFFGLADKNRAFSGLDKTELVDTAKRYIREIRKEYTGKLGK